MAQKGSTEPKASVVEAAVAETVAEAASPIVLTISIPLFLPSPFCFARPIALSVGATLLDGFRYIMRRYCGTYMNSQSTGNPGSSLSQYSSTR